MSRAFEIQKLVDAVHEKYRSYDERSVAIYIPEMAKTNPDHLGICILTVDGQIFRCGDRDQEFTIQSIGKPFAFQVALEELGSERTLAYVGVEPSGDAFNSTELEPRTCQPFNPMVNPEAIAIASLIKKTSPETGVQAFVEKMQLAAGPFPQIFQAVLASETVSSLSFNASFSSFS